MLHLKKSSAPFTRCVIQINDEHIDTAENLDIIMPMYNLIECSDNYSDTSGSLWQFKRDESPVRNTGNPENISTNNSLSFKYKSSILEKPDADGILKNAKIAVSLKYLSKFWQSLEMALINCKIHVELNWTKTCWMSDNDDNTKFEITNTNLCIPIVTLSAEDNVKLTKQLNEGFKRSVYWNQYKTDIKSRDLDDSKPLRIFLDPSFQWIKS